MKTPATLPALLKNPPPSPSGLLVGEASAVELLHPEGVKVTVRGGPSTVITDTHGVVWVALPDS